MWWRNSLNLGHSLFGQAFLLPSDSIQKYRAFRRALELVARALCQQEITCMDLVHYGKNGAFWGVTFLTGM